MYKVTFAGEGFTGTPIVLSYDEKPTPEAIKADISGRNLTSDQVNGLVALLEHCPKELDNRAVTQVLGTIGQNEAKTITAYARGLKYELRIIRYADNYESCFVGSVQ